MYLTSYKLFILTRDTLQAYHKDVNLRLFVTDYERLSQTVTDVNDTYYTKTEVGPLSYSVRETVNNNK